MASRNGNSPNRGGLPEELTQLRIRIAVLETELNIKAREANESERSLVLLTKALAAHPFQNSQSPASNKNHKEYMQEEHDRGHAVLQIELVENLEREIEDLRLDNRSLREKLKNARQTSTSPPLTPGSLRPFEEQPENSPISVEALAVNTPERRCGITHLPLFTPVPTVLPANYSAGVANFGINSLDDVLGSEDGDLLDAPSPPSNSNALVSRSKGKGVATEVLLSDIPQFPVYELDEGALQRFYNPAPVALKTGFELSTSYRGGNYEVQEGNTTSEDESSFQRFPQAGLSQSRWAHTNSNAPGAVTPCRSGEERTQAMMDQIRPIHLQDFRCPNIFKYGIEYLPTKYDTDYFRTVLIGNLPKGINLRDVLARVRGGQIFSATLEDTTPITGSFTAIIQFVHETSAEDYVRFTSLQPITFGDESDDDEKVTAQVTLIPTPAYPLNNGKKNLLFNCGQTRCFCIDNIPSRMSVASLQTDISGRNKARAESLLETYFDEERVLHMEFSSLSAAGIASGVLATYSAYRGLMVQFERDPCAGPVQELLLDVPMRRPFCPKSGFIGYGEVQRDQNGQGAIELGNYSKGGELARAPVRGVKNPDEIALGDTDSTT